jgi:sporulation protein YlmC with PRC-barrel domain
VRVRYLERGANLMLVEGEGEITRARDLSRYPRPTSAAFAVGHLDRMPVMNGNIFNSKGVHVGVVTGDAVFGLKGQKLYDLKGSNIYKLNGDLVGHLSDARGAEKRLDKATDKLFPST